MDELTFTYEIVEGEAFTKDYSLRQSIFLLVNQSYINPTHLIDRIYSVNDTAFVAKLDSQFIGVLLFNYNDRHVLHVDGQAFLAVYNGYAVTDFRYRNQRIIQKLITFATIEFNSRIQLTDFRLLLYAITSNPYALRAYRRVCMYMEPFLDGSYTKSGSLLVTNLKEKLCISILEDAHPFKFTTSLPQRYSLFEQINLDKAPEDEKLFLQRLGVNELLGDRVIFFWGSKDLFDHYSTEKESDELFRLGPSGVTDKTE